MPPPKLAPSVDSEFDIYVLASRTRVTSVNLVRDFRFSIILQEIDVYVLPALVLIVPEGGKK